MCIRDRYPIEYSYGSSEDSTIYLTFSIAYSIYSTSHYVDTPYLVLINYYYMFPVVLHTCYALKKASDTSNWVPRTLSAWPHLNTFSKLFWSRTLILQVRSKNMRSMSFNIGHSKTFPGGRKKYEGNQKRKHTLLYSDVILVPTKCPLIYPGRRFCPFSKAEKSGGATFTWQTSSIK